MVVNFVDECSSTQDEIINGVKAGAIEPPYALVTDFQTNGVGSRGNKWEGERGNLYFSFCIDENDLPDDLKAISASIYFANLMSSYLKGAGSKIWIKWPNDFYIDNKKIGGVITTKIKSIYICGMGINLKNSPSFANILDIEIKPTDIVYGFIKYLQSKPTWKQIFINYLLEFEKSKKFSTHVNDELMSLKNAVLADDGSVIINGKKVYSLR